MAIFPAEAAAAQEPAVGWEQGEVLRYWGAPDEKVEFESKREELWLYRHSQVVFREGLLLHWINNSTTANQKSLKFQPLTGPHTDKRKTTKAATGEGFKDILTEIREKTTSESSLTAGSNLADAKLPNLPPLLPKR